MRLGPQTCFVISLVLVLSVNIGQAQTATTGALAGVVVDQSGAVIPGATIELKDSAKGWSESASTDREGVYHFFFLRPGYYTVEVTHAGFERERRTVSVQVGLPLTLNLALQIETARNDIVVQDESPVVQAENADVSATVTQKQVSEVPNPGNDLTYIAQTTPGAVMNTDGGILSKFSILGMSGFSYGFTLDGMSLTENTLNVVRGGALGITLGANQVEEATVVTTGYSGEFGGVAGGNINYVGKSGANAFHGNAQYYWNGRVLNANDWFANGFGTPRPFSIANQWAGSLGGPIKKDKLFFFFDTEGLRLTIPQVFLTVIPSLKFEQATLKNIDTKFGSQSASDAFYKQIFRLYDGTPGAASAQPGGFIDPLGCGGFTGPNGLGTTDACARNVVDTRGRPSHDTLTSGRVDWNMSAKDRVFLRIQQEGGLAAQFDDQISSIFDNDYTNYRWQGQIVETHTFSPSTANQLLIGVSDHYWAYQPSHPGEGLAAFPTTLSFSVPGTFTALGSFNSLGFYSFDSRTVQISEDFTKISGSHKLAFGMNFDRERWLNHSIFNGTGQLFPQTLQAFYEGGFDQASSSVDFTTLVQGFSSRPDISVQLGGMQAYALDEWRVRKNLVLTLGLRAEHRQNFSCENGCFARLKAPFAEISHDPALPYNQVLLANQEHAFPDLDLVNWSPRFGFAWQPFGITRNSVLRGGIGIFYDPFQEALAEDYWLNPPAYNSFAAFNDNLSPAEITSLFRDTAASNKAFVDGFAAGATLLQMQSQIPNFAPPMVESAERQMHRPQYQKWSLEWQQALGTRTSLNVGYFGHHGIHELVRDPSANAFGFGSLPPAPCSSPPVPPCSDPRFGEVEHLATIAVSNYNGMVTSFRHQFSRAGGGLIGLNYTYGHALDEVSNSGIWSFTLGSSLSPQDPSNLRAAYGPAEYDVRHSLNANYVWELPLKAAFAGHGPDVLLKGWQVSGTVFARTGFPYTVFDMAQSGNLQRNNYFGQIYAVPVGPLSTQSTCGEAATIILNAEPCLPSQFFADSNGATSPNPHARFIQATCETDFNAGHLPAASGPCGGPVVSFSQGRNRFRGPSYFNADLAIIKNTRIPGWEAGTLAIGFQFFNAFNHPNFATPDNWSSDPTFGLIFGPEQPPSSILGSGLNAATAARMIQVKAELRF